MQAFQPGGGGGGLFFAYQPYLHLCLWVTRSSRKQKMLLVYLSVDQDEIWCAVEGIQIENTDTT